MGQVGDIIGIRSAVVRALQDDQFIGRPARSASASGTRLLTSRRRGGVKLAPRCCGPKLLMLTNIPSVLDKQGQLLPSSP